MLLLGYVTGQALLPHFDPLYAAPGSLPQTLCYGLWVDLSTSYATTCRVSWLWPMATWVNLSGALISYTLRFLLMAFGRGIDGAPLDHFNVGLFEALAVFAVPTALVLIVGVLFWIHIARQAFMPRRSSVSR